MSAGNRPCQEVTSGSSDSLDESPSEKHHYAGRENGCNRTGNKYSHRDKQDRFAAVLVAERTHQNLARAKSGHAGSKS